MNQLQKLKIINALQLVDSQILCELCACTPRSAFITLSEFVKKHGVKKICVGGRICYQINKRGMHAVGDNHYIEFTNPSLVTLAKLHQLVPFIRHTLDKLGTNLPTADLRLKKQLTKQLELSRNRVCAPDFAVCKSNTHTVYCFVNFKSKGSKVTQQVWDGWVTNHPHARILWYVPVCVKAHIQKQAGIKNYPEVELIPMEGIMK